ncbi:MAG: hypothetical protein NTW16_19860 [Bacteroidetes bacterium]|nr:hypothetical protein [Bacteroidota bacterium]
MKKYASIAIFIVLIIISAVSLHAQVGISTDSSIPDPSAMFEVKSTTKGMLIPRLTTSERTAILSPAPGLLVYDTNTQSFWFYKATGWTELVGGGCGTSSSFIHDANNDTKVQTEKYPNEDMVRFDLAGIERMVLYPNRLELLHTNYNFLLGSNTGTLTTGIHNTGLGMNVLSSNITGFDNTAAGYGSLYNNTGDFNTALGSQTLYYNTSGYENTALGYLSLNSNIDGNYNTGIGSHALNTNLSGSRNTAVGEGALWSTQGSNNTAVGFRAGNSAGSGNVFLGNLAGNLELGSNKLYIDNSETTSPLIWGDFYNRAVNFNGRVGIGTTNPLNNLHIVASSNPLRLEGLHTTANLNFLVVDENGVASKRPNGGPTITDDDKDTKIQAEKYPDEDILRFDIAGSEKMTLRGDRLTMDGKLGIGTINPQNQLHVVATANPLRLEGLQTTQNSYFLVVDNNGVITKRPEGGVGMGWELEGNAGLGSPANFVGTTDSASLNFRVNNFKAGSIDIDRKNTYFGYKALYSNSSGSFNVAIGNHAGYYETGSDKLYIDNRKRASLSDGHDKALIWGEFADDPTAQRLALNAKVGIGTTNPQNSLHIVSDADPIRLEGLNTGTSSEVLVVDPNGVVFKRDGDFGNWLLKGNAGTNSATDFIGTTDTTDFVIRTDSIERARVTGLGDIGIGTSTPKQKLELKNGNFLLSNSGTASELRLAEPSGGLNYTAFKAQPQNVDITYTLPSAAATAGQLLSNNGSGVLNWVSPPATNEIKDADNDTKVQVEESPDEDKIRFDLGGTEQWVMTGARLEPKNSGYSVYIGDSAGFSDDLGINYNVFIGYRSGRNNTLGYMNTANGSFSFKSNTTGTENTANGSYALYSNITGSNNTAMGVHALSLNTSGGNNTAIGWSALNFNRTGSENVAIGVNSLGDNIGGNANIAIGQGSLGQNTSGYNNIAIGSSALSFNSANSRSTAIGINSMYYTDSRTSGRETFNTAIGYESLMGSGNPASNTGQFNTAVGDQAMFSNQSGSNNTANGSGALRFNTTGRYNTASGSNALRSNITGSENTAIGSYALGTNVSCSSSTAIGYYAMCYAYDGIAGYSTNNTAVGSFALAGNPISVYNSGMNNTALGYQSLYSNSSGSHNTGIGVNALRNNENGNDNTACGNLALSNNKSNDNTAFGAFTLTANTYGNFNTAFGTTALVHNLTGASNTAVGYGSLWYNEGNSRSTAIGYQAMYNADDRTSGRETFNTAVGYEALKGSSSPTNNSGDNNTAIGDQSLYSNSSGQLNVAVGNQALYSNSTGLKNTAIGYKALYSGLGSDEQNTAVGYYAGGNNLSWANSFFGSEAGYNTNSGGWNTFIGGSCGYNNTTGYRNTFIGKDAGLSNISGYDNVVIGCRADLSPGYLNNCIVIGASTTGNYSHNSITLGNATHTQLICQAAYNNPWEGAVPYIMVSSSGLLYRHTSSKKYRTEIRELEFNTKKLFDLKPVSYTSLLDGQNHFGLNAEDVAEVLPELVYFEKAKDVIKGSTSEELIPEDINYNGLTVLLLKELQDLRKDATQKQDEIETRQSVIDSQQLQIVQLQEKFDAMQKQVDELKELMGREKK